MLPVRYNHHRFGSLVDASPFAMVDEMRREFDRVFDRMFGAWNDPYFAPTVTRFNHGWYPAADVQETDKEVRITLEAPGLGPDDIHVEVANDTLTISGDKNLHRDEERDGYYMLERRTGHFQRRFSLPSTANADRIEAEYENGVLTITIPKKAEATNRRRIEIKSSFFQKLLGRGTRNGESAKADTSRKEPYTAPQTATTSR